MEIFMMRMLCLKDGKRRQDVRMWEFRRFCEFREGQARKMETFSRFQFMSHRRLSCHNSASQDVNRKMRHIHIIILLSTSSFSFSFFSFAPRNIFALLFLTMILTLKYKRKAIFPVCDPQTNTLTYAQTYNIHARRLLFIERFTNIGKNMK